MIRKLVTGLLALVVLCATAAAAWYKLIYLPPRYSSAAPEAVAALASVADVEVIRNPWIVMRPRNAAPETGFIFYPGGEVDPVGYTEPLLRIASAGYLVVNVPMPLDLAVLAPDRADSVVAAFPAIKRWVIGGHSLGGAMAGHYVRQHPRQMAGLLLWDAYVDDDDDLSGQVLPVRQIHRLEPDGQAPAKYRETRRLLPEATQLVPLAGASHINYGRFNPAQRFRDAPPATIPIELQHEQVAVASIEFLAQIARTPR